MISREDYNKALDVVEAYHIQLAQLITTPSKRKYKSLQDLEVGDFVECVEVHGNSKENLTKGKDYEVVNLSEYDFYIISDKGRKKFYSYSNSQFKALN